MLVGDVEESCNQGLCFINITQSYNPTLGPPGRAVLPTPGSTAQFRAALWTNLEKLMDQICAACRQVNTNCQVYQTIESAGVNISTLK